MHIFLSGDVVYKTGLTYAQACEALRKANALPLAEHTMFFMRGGGLGDDWEFCGRQRLSKSSDLVDEFIIEIEEVKK